MNNRPLYDELDDMYDLLYRDGCKLESLRNALQRSQEAIWHLYREAMRAVAKAYWSTESTELEAVQRDLRAVFEKAIAAGGSEDIYDEAYHAGGSRGVRADAIVQKKLRQKNESCNTGGVYGFMDDCAREGEDSGLTF